MSWCRVLGHRFIAVPLALALLVAGWNIYIAVNDGGIIEGEVRDRAGAPVAGATVVFFERNFVYYEEKQRATTDAEAIEYNTKAVSPDNPTKILGVRLVETFEL